MADNFFLFIEKRFTRRKSFFASVDPTKLNDSQRDLLKRYRLSLMMMAGGTLALFVTPFPASAIGMIAAIAGWKVKGAVEKVLEVELQPYMKDMPTLAVAAAVAVPSNAKAVGKGPWVVYFWDSSSGKENVLRRFEVEEDARKYARSEQKTVDKNKPQNGQSISVMYSPD